MPQVDDAGEPILKGADEDGAGEPVLGGENDARQVFHRLAGCWTHWGEKYGYFDSEEDAEAFWRSVSRRGSIWSAKASAD